jgi:hypothetical protein
MEHLSSEMEQQNQLQWRRDKVQVLYSKGYSQREISQTLQVGLATVNRDITYLRQQAKANIKKYIDERLPEEYEKCLVGLNAITKEAWNTAQGTEDKRGKLQALSLAKDCYSMKLELLTNATVVDGANPSFIKSLKLQIGEESEYDQVIARYKAQGLGNATKDMRIVPINFNREHKAMLAHCKMILEHDPGKVAINPDKFDKLITALRTAVDIDGTLDKEATSYNDIFDAFRLALNFYHFEERTD